MSKVVHCKKEKYDVYIGRPSKWGNPFSCKKESSAKFKVNTKEEAIESYKKWITSGEGRYLLKDLHELKGKVLGCWCKPEACHGDVLFELTNMKGIVIFSGSNSPLGAALTNPTHYNPKGGTSFSKGKLLPPYDILNLGLVYKGKKYKDVEEAFLKLRGEDLRGQLELMIDLLYEKFIQYPLLFLHVDKFGGREFLEMSVHMYDAKIDPAKVERGKTEQRWTSDGDDLFMYCLIQAYDKYVYYSF